LKFEVEVALFLIPPTCGEGGWPKASRVGVTRAWTKQPPTRHIVRAAHDVPPSPQKWEEKKRACHCEERMRRSNPAFLFALSARGLLRSARNDRTKLILRAPSCVQYNGMAGLHPSPRLRWGGWREAPGGGNSRIQEIAPTRHIVRAAHDVPPQSELRSSRPHKVGGTRKSERRSARLHKGAGFV
jgi:hypothetical protein